MSEIGNHKRSLDTPVLWVDLDRLEHNIAALAGHFRSTGVAWRPHTKGIKVPAIAHKMLAAGAQGITCAKLGEAEVMAAAGISDILVANQIVTPPKITRLVQLRNYADVKVAVDCIENARDIGAVAHAHGTEIGVLIEVDIGMERCGTLPGAPTLALAQQIQDLAGLRLLGLMAWEGHTLQLTDPQARRDAIRHAVDRVVQTAELCRAHGIAIDVISAGGSGTYKETSRVQGVTEIQAGGGVFCDMAYQAWGVDLEPALFVRATVISRPTPTRIVLDAGFKTLPRGFATPMPVGVEHVKASVYAAEHGIITLNEPNDALKIGDAIDIIVGYSDATVFAHDVLYGVRGEDVEAVWAIQGRGKLR
jgi:D-serine deaminase-like pyridoxal phosphate-dependent protein